MKSKLLKTIRFDPSDTHVFETAANPDEWAIPGTFWFQSLQQEDLRGMIRQAFSNGFLSLQTYGFSTFTSVAEISPDELHNLETGLADKLISDFNAPDMEQAREAAWNELDYVVKMCSETPINSIFAIRRELDMSNNIKESFSLVEMPGEPTHTKVWEIID